MNKLLLVCGVGLLALLPVVEGGHKSDLAAQVADSDDLDNAYPLTKRVPLLRNREEVDYHMLFGKKLGKISSQRIWNAIGNAAHFYGVPEDWLTRAVFITSRWGSFESLGRIKEFLEERDLRTAFTGNAATLADVLYYLYNKKCLKKTVFLKRTTTDKQDALKPWESRYSRVRQVLNEDGTMYHGVMLLDDITIKRSRKLLRREGDWRELVHDLNSARNSFVTPYGWVGGLTVFSQMNFVKIIEDLAGRMQIALQRIGGEPQPDFMDRVVDSAIVFEHPLWSAMSKDFVDNYVDYIDFIAASELGGPEDYGPNAIARNLAPYFNPESIKKGNELAKGCYFEAPDGIVDSTLRSCRFQENDYLRYLMEYGAIVSMQRLGRYVKAAYRKVVERFPASRYYCIMEKDKSTNVVYHLWFMLTGEDVRNLYDCKNKAVLESVRRQLDQEEAGILIVDDLAVSGAQLSESFASVKKALMGQPKPHVRAVPLMFTKEASVLFNEGGSSGPVKALGGRVIRDGGMGSWMYQLGFDDGRYAIALPWMSPDNNNMFFALYGAKSFTYNGCGVKNIEPEAEAVAEKTLKVCSRMQNARDDKQDRAIMDCLMKEDEYGYIRCYGSLRMLRT